ncbi:glycosyltransferase [Acidovorax sp. NCPPB 2350]|nr:glycosyltransferase [Acidovorax sp. NCPPB 2350]
MAAEPKVMQVITKGERGGAQTHVRTLCRALAPQVRFSAVIGGTEPAPLESDLHALGLPVHRAPSLRNSLAPWHLGRSVLELRALIRQHEPDVLHAHSAVAGVVARVAGRLCRKPVVYTVHGFAFKPEAPWLRRTVAWCCEWLLARWTQHMVCVSAHELQLAQGLPVHAGRQTVVPNAVEDDGHRAQPGLEPACIAMVARLAAPKRPDLLLHALARLRDALGHEVPASIIGDGPDRVALQAQAHQLALHQVGFVGDADDVPRRLARHSIFVLLSDHEGLPISVIEAMRAGLPIVASHLPGIGELLPSDRHGALVPNEVEAIAHALERLARSSALRERLGRAARTRYEERHTPEHMASAILAIYTQALA